MRIVKPAEIARARGILPPGLAALAAFWVCQKIAGRPRVSMNTNWERASLGRSSTRSITGPRRLHDATGVSITSAPSGQGGFVGVTVDPGRARPCIAGLQHQTCLYRQVQQVGQ